MEPLDIKREFSLDRLPVTFAMGLARGEDGKLDRRPLNEAVRHLANLIWQTSGFRFRHCTTEMDNEAQVFRYFCSQNKEKEQESKGRGKRDILRSERFECGGRLTMRVYLDGRILVVTMKHLHHKPYVNVELDANVQDFVDTRIAESTPSQIYRDLMASDLPRAASVTQKQVYYRWQQGNALNWRRHSDQFESAMTFLSEPSATALCDSEIFTSGNLRGLALFVRESMSSLHAEAKELAMDATFGTNNAGMDLFAVLAEVDGAGVPLAYCFMGITPSVDGVRRADAGALTHILELFLQRIRSAGFSPTFFGMDKDASEIAAVKLVWPEATLQLCYWHVKRAVRTKLKDASLSKTQNQYVPTDALKFVPGLEICWGSLPTRRPDGDHRYGRCQCPSAGTNFEEKGRIEPMSPKDKDTVLQMISRHFNYHPLIPDWNGTFCPPENIHRQCASEVYEWCKARGFFRLWAYLFVNWYRPGQWELWAKSANGAEIPVLQTTMIVESHWRRLKHDFLHQFNRPRIDLVAWILVTRVIPDTITRMQGIRSGGNRTATAPWRKPFKKEWKNLQGKIMNPDNINRYHTDPLKWVCACEAFITSRFLICKHLVHCVLPFDNTAEFFRNVQRRRTWPFWDHNQLVVLPEFRVRDLTDGAATQAYQPTESCGTGSEIEEDSELGEDAVSDNGSDFQVEDQSRDNAADSQIFDEFLTTMQSITEIAREQHQKGNRAFVDRLIASNAGNRMLLQEIHRKRNRRSMPQTWDQYRHPATMYYN